ncbi:GNAT family N-acetyltransferase [Sutcliffiella horikoshii]|uniref:GNAT family N-acetyltransferase n=1 Tax=Sutcliffiella horikoshii TaxID=79883 RepID=UPI001CFC6743|nr:GNAT family N-acetyltransferase [Sutcliffiella horikoshii]
MEITKTNNLSKKEYQEVVELLETCESFDGFEISTSINLSMFQKGGCTHLYLILAREKEELIGFLGLFSFIDPKKMELAGMIHPQYRNQGMFSGLLESAKEITSARDANEVLFVCPAMSDAAIHLALKMEATYVYSKFTMEYHEKYHKKYDCLLQNMSIKKANLSETAIILRLLSDGFDVAPTDENLKSLIERNTLNPGFELFLVHIDTTPIATITVSHEEKSLYLSAYAITPTHRGKGYGRAIIEKIVSDIKIRYPEKAIRLDVDVKNEGAIKLYENTGFRVVGGYEYYLAK